MNTVTEFLSVFYPDPNEPIWLRSFDAKKVPREMSQRVEQIEVTRERLSADKDLQRRLVVINKRQGLYFVVNAGGNNDADINRINAVFCEFDNKPMIEQHDIFDNIAPWMPSIRIETRKSVHAYYLLSEPITVEQFKSIQLGIIKLLGSDPAIKNPSRVMRLPFFNHVAYDGGYQYQKITCHTFRPDLRYSLAELTEGFPYKPKQYHYQPMYSPDISLEAVKAELRTRVMNTETFRRHGKWGSANARCHGGEGPTGLRVDFESGAVTCWSDCSLEKILNAYGLEMPRGNKSGFEYIPRRQQKSELYRWYQGVKNEI